ncbi:carboxyvinyl-carboxyphosphonate phosphorylmutase [Cyclospora cayetanensis]|uniref:Carboxyvinyl-carboxyphosphonate phosphorylmutase n=1 Tax=Cyclospora cayetanensis TaxID=88456 RepID=A0A1D3D0S6_9EIME|nr:carboxyvinyl-carboxyphosphonate phosphorylmutase [Cyclospora cayetanensis]
MDALAAALSEPTLDAALRYDRANQAEETIIQCAAESSTIKRSFLNSVHAGRRLRTLMEKEFLLIPGAFNGISARLAAQQGFRALYLSGAALSASQGLPDIGLVPSEDFCRTIHEMNQVTSLPILADADTGFGGTEKIRKVVFDFHFAGAAGLHIEDQQMPKRCGHLSGKTLISVDEMKRKIEAAKKAAEDFTSGDFIICARTDAFAVEGLEGAIGRACRYVESGADMIFPEGLNSLSAFSSFATALRDVLGPAPGGGPFLLANMTEFGQTPMLKANDFKDAGFHCAIYPVSALRVAMKAIRVR